MTTIILERYEGAPREQVDLSQPAPRDRWQEYEWRKVVWKDAHPFYYPEELTAACQSIARELGI